MQGPIFPTVIKMREYLTDNGWNYDGEDFDWARFTKKTARGWVTFGKAHATARYQAFGDGTSLLTTRLFDDKIDLDAKCIDLVRVLEFIEQRSQDEILKEMA